VIAALRLAEETGDDSYAAVARNFWLFSTGHHSYVIGGQGNHEHWGPPDVVAGALSNYTCEGCVSYNMLKLTRLLHFHEPGNAAYMDYYERTLVNHLLGTQDPGSPHGFAAYYTGLSPGAHKQVPANYFPHTSDSVFATDYDTFTCDTATGLETPTRFIDTIYTRDPDGALRVNLFIPSQVTVGGLTFRQATSIPNAMSTTITVEAGAGPMTLRVRVPAWATFARATLNGRPLPVPSQSVVEVTRDWRPGDELLVGFTTDLALRQAPDNPRVTAVSYGPVVLAALTGDGSRPPAIDMESIRQVSSTPLAFQARGGFGSPGDTRPISLIPVCDVAHQRYTTYWRLA
ncbi:MAG: beta-L-arabinofuranosidase domain-containing protein, partial [Trebonia sp.]